MFDLEWGKNSSEGEDMVSENENENESEANGERNMSQSSETRGCEEGESSETRECEHKGESSIAQGCESERISNVFTEDVERVYERRIRRPPSYLSDYIITNELTEDEALVI